MKILNQKLKSLLLAALFLFPVAGCLHAQVTIGSGVSPNSGAMLDIKANNNTVNATGGVNFPRVAISDFSPATAAALATSIGSTGSWDMQTHIGLVVYNTGTPQGLHVWDGARWKALGGAASSGETIWLPSFDLVWGAVGTELQANLYNMYRDAFLPSSYQASKYISSTGAAVVVPAHGDDLASSFIYVITHYDSDIMENVSIDANGVLKYTPKVAALPINAYVNILLVRK